MRATPLTPEQSYLCFLQLPDEIDRPANALFDQLLGADSFLAARAARDAGHAFADALQQQRRISRAEADWARLTFDNQWCKRIDALDAQRAGGGA